MIIGQEKDQVGLFGKDGSSDLGRFLYRLFRDSSLNFQPDHHFYHYLDCYNELNGILKDAIEEAIRFFINKCTRSDP